MKNLKFVIETKFHGFIMSLSVMPSIAVYTPDKSKAFVIYSRKDATAIKNMLNNLHPLFPCHIVKL
jgi:hypothetical protein